MHIEVKPRARRQLRSAYEWWWTHRDKAPNALEADFDEAIARIRRAPHTGTFVQKQRSGIVRRYLMERVRYYLFYRIKLNGDIDILQLWHASRRPPKR